jgi:hypothetical protein
MLKSLNRRIAVGAAAALVSSFAIFAAPAGAAAVTGVTASPSPLTAGAPATYTVAFTTSGTGALTSGVGTITLTGPAGTVFPGPAADYTVNGTPVALAPFIGPNNVTLKVPVGIGNTTAVTVVAGVGATATNPSAAGTYSVNVNTSADVTAVASSPTYTITNASASSMGTPMGGAQSATIGTAFANLLSVTVVDQFSNPIAGVSVIFTAPASGASGTFANGTNTTTAISNASGVATATVYTANATAGTYQIVASSAGLTSVAFTETNAVVAHGYWLVGSDGGIFSFGSSVFQGSAAALHLVRPIVGIAATPDRGGYYLVGGDGGVFNFGDAMNHFYGSLSGTYSPAGSGGPHPLNKPIIGIVPTIDNLGYFLVGADGGIFTFGDAKYAGSCPGVGGCVGTAVTVAPDATGNGYWLFTTTGYAYAFGDAGKFGSPGPQSVPVTSAARTPNSMGYWILFSNGAVASYGNANNYGSPLGSIAPSNPATAIFATADGAGYWVATANGTVYNYGDAPSDGGTTALHLNGSIIAASGS